MKKIINKSLIVIAMLFITIALFLFITGANYKTKENGSLSFSVAKPIAKTRIDGDAYISNYFEKPLIFHICNYENNTISDVALQYYININVTQENAPLIYKLYRVYSVEKEEEIEISINKNGFSTINPIKMNPAQKLEHTYRLEIQYNNESSTNLDKNLGISILVNNEQVEINKENK